MKQRYYLRTEMKDELGKGLYDALELLEEIYAEVWCHFDPACDRGDKDQPKDIKEMLGKVRKLFERNNLCIEGWEKSGEEVL
jgi:hypothetical protein